MKTFTLNKDLLQDSGIPEPYWTLGADTYEGRERALLAVERYTENVKNPIDAGLGMFLTGARNTAKTFLLTYALRRLMFAGYDVKYYKLDQLVELYFSKEKGSSFMSMVKEPVFLGIDSVGIPDKGGSPLVLDQVVRARKDDHKPMLLAADLNMDEMSSHYQSETMFYIQNECCTITAAVDPVVRDRLMRRKKKANKYAD